jgi:hypothetical protein
MEPFVVRLADDDRNETPRLQDKSLQLQSSALLEPTQMFLLRSEEDETPLLLPKLSV